MRHRQCPCRAARFHPDIQSGCVRVCACMHLICAMASHDMHAPQTKHAARTHAHGRHVSCLFVTCFMLVVITDKPWQMREQGTQVQCDRCRCAYMQRHSLDSWHPLLGQKKTASGSFVLAECVRAERLRIQAAGFLAKEVKGGINRWSQTHRDSEPQIPAPDSRQRARHAPAKGVSMRASTCLWTWNTVHSYHN